MRGSAASLLAGLALVAAGCGGGGGGGNALPEAAKVVPASAPALISFRTDFSSTQYRNTVALLRKLPDALPALQRLSTQGDIDFEQDVKPALGPELDVVWLDFKNGGNNFVVLTQPRDKTKFQALAKKGPPGTATGEIHGWSVAGGSQAEVDAFRRASSGDTLDGVGAFKDAMSRLDENSAVRTYVAGEPVQRQLDRALEGSGAPSNLTRQGVARLESISAAGLIESKGIRIDSALATDPAPSPKTVTPTLAGSLPSGALLYVDTADLSGPTRTILELVGRSLPKFETQLHQVETILGVSLESDVYPLLSREEAFALYPAQPIPFLVFVSKAPDENRAREVLGHVLSLAKLSGSLEVSASNVGDVEVDEVSQPGGSTHVFVAVGHGKLIVTTARNMLPTLIKGEGPKLADDARYQEARTDAKVPSKVVATVYADLTQGLPFAFNLAEAHGRFVPTGARRNTQALSHALLYAQQDGKRFRLRGFLAIK